MNDFINHVLENFIFWKGEHMSGIKFGLVASISKGLRQDHHYDARFVFRISDTPRSAI